MLEVLVQAKKKAQLDRLRPMSVAALAHLQKHYDVDLTYTSNAIEGNSLTLRETAEVIDHGITVGGKSLRDHLEAVDHCDALLWMRDMAATSTPITEQVVCELHRWIVARSQPAMAGTYSRLPRRIAGSPVVFPNPMKIPQLREEFDAWLPQFHAALRPDDAAIFTADHGCDPTVPGTDHTREYVPLLVSGPRVRPGVDLGLRASLSDIGQTVAANFGAAIEHGASFLPQIL